MKQIILTFEETDDGLVGMQLESKEDKPTKSEGVVHGQMINYIVKSKLKSYCVGRGSSSDMEEAKRQARIAADIYLAGQ